jgi:hypothetical protein
MRTLRDSRGRLANLHGTAGFDRPAKRLLMLAQGMNTFDPKSR